MLGTEETDSGDLEQGKTKIPTPLAHDSVGPHSPCGLVRKDGKNHLDQLQNWAFYRGTDIEAEVLRLTKGGADEEEEGPLSDSYLA